MKNILLFILFPLSLFGQNEVLLIKTLEDYKASQYVFMNHLSIEKRTEKDIYWSSDYKIFAPDKKIQSLIEKEYWGALKGDSLFVNCSQQGICNGFAYAEQIGNYLFILVPRNPLEEEDVLL